MSFLATWIFAFQVAPGTPIVGGEKYLYAAYAATWAIHIVYLVILTRGYKKLREDVEDLERE